MATALIDRRAFLRACGSVWLASLLPAPALALARADAVYATSFMLKDGSFAIATVTERGEIVDRQALPARAHGVTVCPATGLAVFFARRPGTFAMAYDPSGRRPPVTFHTPPERHFYDHGAFSPDGRRLYATENDYEHARGVIGVYDATDGFRRVGEMPSYGVGPHDVSVTRGGRMLIVANGGIETRPDYARVKLNLGSMEPSLAFIDAGSGALVEKHTLPPALHRLSTRHVAEDDQSRIWFGCQYEGAETDAPPVLGRLSLGEAIRFVGEHEPAMRRLRNYVGAIAVNAAAGCIGVASPMGGAAIILDLRSDKVVSVVEMRAVAGIAASRSGEGMVLSSYSGAIAGRDHPGIAWDQHIADLRPL
ncbi:MAG: DUF1513 domain-containing protein [Pararhizobium sp.]